MANFPTVRPAATPAVVAKRKWKPTSTREFAFSSSASVKLRQQRSVLAGAAVVDVMQKRKWSPPVNLRRISAGARTRQGCLCDLKNLTITAGAQLGYECPPGWMKVLTGTGPFAEG